MLGPRLDCGGAGQHGSPTVANAAYVSERERGVGSGWSHCSHVALESRGWVLPFVATHPFLSSTVEFIRERKGERKREDKQHQHLLPGALETHESCCCGQIPPQSTDEFRGHCLYGAPAGTLTHQVVSSELTIHAWHSQTDVWLHPPLPTLALFLDSLPAGTFCCVLKLCALINT